MPDEPSPGGNVYAGMTVLPVRFLATLIMVLAIALPRTAPAAGPPAPEITAEVWLNSEPLSMADLRGRVVLVEFWTFACFNCRNVEPYIRRWHETYGQEGLVVIAVHSPEFDFEKEMANVRDYVADRAIAYPVAVDNDFSTWRAYENRAWPTVYLVDREGHLVYRQIGEGRYAETEARIRELLAEPYGDT